ncbi:hypothetical protein AA0119_g7283 [Alternaria tenuissima]|uniref:DUF676 domain-containing protein n=1 Tax=Alternaria tenuissima TaxID=119927 RepID=A0ABY0G9V1_9PLEO|nr:TPR repeat:NB-ARC [Alternaria alternata]RYN97558.1 hypothetical protein AA0119_g7283 [Alternaria tenuissima]RYO15646.1 hypothetical protein AA0121_g6904 [Alternaria tenuissima]
MMDSLYSFFRTPSSTSVPDDELPDSNELFSTTGPCGIATLFDPEDPLLDIIFVHGLTGGRETTWTHKGKKQTLWPRDLLPEDIPRARIITFGYDADVASFGLSVAGSNRLRDHGNNLASDVATFREKTDTPTKRPIIFVAHSLGGLVVEQALIISRGSPEDYLGAILEATYGIIFMGTPHMGADKARWLNTLTKVNNVLNKSNGDIVALLEPSSEMLANLQREFHTMLEKRREKEGKRVKLYCFYEELPVRGIGKKIVEDNSAVLSPTENAAIHGTHMSMTKFVDRKDTGYCRVQGQIWLWVKALNYPNAQQRKPHTLGGTQGSPRSYEQSHKAKMITYSGTINAGGGPVIQTPEMRSAQSINISGRSR